MSGSDSLGPESPSILPSEGAGVLAKLPRTRPQRSTPRRTAARNATATPKAPPASGLDPSASRQDAAKVSSAARAKPVKRRNASEVTPRGAGAPRRTAPSRPAREPVPSQGFECQTESASGPVAPPGGAELVASAIEVVAELAKAGVASGERLLKDLIARLPLP